MSGDSLAMNFPIYQTEKLLLRMFEVAAILPGRSESVEEKLLKEGMILSKFWWRQIPSGYVKLVF